jgi:hypothetical protein
MADEQKNGSGESAEKASDQVEAGEGSADGTEGLDWVRFTALFSAPLIITGILPVAQEYIKDKITALILSVLLVVIDACLIAFAPKLISRLRQARNRTINLRAPALYAVLVVAALIGALAGFGIKAIIGQHGQLKTRLVTVKMAGSSGFFDDLVVQKELRHLGFVVQQTPEGSLDVCRIHSLARDYDVANSGSPEAAECVVPILARANRNPDITFPYLSPMAIITYTTIVKLLKQIHVVTEFHGIAIFNVLSYLNVVRRGERWDSIPGNTAYQNHSHILLTTTDPQHSNSGGMFATIAYAAQNGDSPVAAYMNPVYLKVIKQCFSEQGHMDAHTDFLLKDFLTAGMGAIPMAMIYENDYIYTQLDGRRQLSGPTGPNPQITVMYPNPDVAPDNTLTSWTQHGNMLTTLLQMPPLTHFEEEHGYRTSIDTNNFVQYMARKGITVPSLSTTHPQIVNLPAEAYLQALINVVVPPKLGD